MNTENKTNNSHASEVIEQIGRLTKTTEELETLQKENCKIDEEKVEGILTIIGRVLVNIFK